VSGQIQNHLFVITRVTRKPTAAEFLFFEFVFGYARIVHACIRMWRLNIQARSETIPLPEEHSLRTSVSLLDRLRQHPRDESAWNDFVARYEPQLLKWCRGWRLNEADARDVTQAVLLKLSRLMENFAYDPARSFRGWLKTLTHHAWRDLVAERKRAGIGSGDSRMLEFFESLEAGDDLVRHIEQEFERELFEQAIERVRPRVRPRTWDAFRLTALEGCSGAAAAAQLELTVDRVYGARSEVKRMIQDEVRKLEGID
jgi:RNA polymerase sigma factor (sigma-70 family)